LVFSRLDLVGFSIYLSTLCSPPLFCRLPLPGWCFLDICPLAAPSCLTLRECFLFRCPLPRPVYPASTPRPLGYALFLTALPPMMGEGIPPLPPAHPCIPYSDDSSRGELAVQSYHISFCAWRCPRTIPDSNLCPFLAGDGPPLSRTGPQLRFQDPMR